MLESAFNDLLEKNFQCKEDYCGGSSGGISPLVIEVSPAKEERSGVETGCGASTSVAF